MQADLIVTKRNRVHRAWSDDVVGVECPGLVRHMFRPVCVDLDTRGDPFLGGSEECTHGS
jgi:hypothetical protein